MKRILKIGGVMVAIAAPIAQAQVINFHAANNNMGSQYAAYNGYNLLYFGQGAYSDPGNNIWNGFGQYPGAGSTYFYGGGLPDNHNLPGNPGNPYASYTGGSAHGNALFSPANSSASAGNATSAGLLSAVTLSMSYGGDNGLGSIGGNNSIHNGTPGFLLGEAAIVNGGSPGIGTSSNPLGSFTLNNVAAGSYDLFLYGANYNNDRGAAFSITIGGGTAMGGITSAINAANGSPASSFVLGQDYVEFVGVTPVGGEISGTWGAVSNSISGNSGEGDFNGLQLVAVVPEPAALALFGLGLGGLCFLRRRK
jgi:hypothetical protein